VVRTAAGCAGASWLARFTSEIRASTDQRGAGFALVAGSSSGKCRVADTAPVAFLGKVVRLIGAHHAIPLARAHPLSVSGNACADLEVERDWERKAGTSAG
jgi:hypothetical protein